MILRKYAEYGDDWERILNEIKSSPLFTFDLYLHSLTPKNIKEKTRNLINNLNRTKEKIEKEKIGGTNDGNDKKKTVDVDDDDDDEDNDDSENDNESDESDNEELQKKRKGEERKGGRRKNEPEESDESDSDD